jgi:hypothetical protein
MQGFYPFNLQVWWGYFLALNRKRTPWLNHFYLSLELDHLMRSSSRRNNDVRRLCWSASCVKQDICYQHWFLQGKQARCSDHQWQPFSSISLRLLAVYWSKKTPDRRWNTHYVRWVSQASRASRREYPVSKFQPTMRVQDFNQYNCLEWIKGFAKHSRCEISKLLK